VKRLANDRTEWKNFTSALCSERSNRRWRMDGKEETNRSLLGLNFNPVNGSDMFLWNVRLFPNYRALKSRRLYTSYRVTIMVFIQEWTTLNSLISIYKTLQLSTYCVQIEDYLFNLQVTQKIFMCHWQFIVWTVGLICRNCTLHTISLLQVNTKTNRLFRVITSSL
jgi:hypothetical protein